MWNDSSATRTGQGAQRTAPEEGSVVALTAPST